ncbi:MAG: metallophosphoesterase family protein [Acetivibrio sp.]
MKLAVMSDIHSNIVAFEACLAYIEKNPVDGVVFLGDYVSDCPEPQLTLEKIYQLKKQMPTWMIRGNREEYFLNYRDGYEKNWRCSSYKGSLLYTYENLTKKDLEWFESMDSTVVLKIEGTEALRLVHGSISSSRELLDAGKDNTKKHLEESKEKYIVAGHTHRQMQYEHAGKVIINPGSVGVAIGVQKKANMAYLTWEREEWKAQFLSIPFSYEKVNRWFAKSSLLQYAYVWPQCILKSMEIGENMGPLCAKRAYDLAVMEKNLDTEGNPPEEYWIRSAKELRIL